jgi:F0F1-type ATP synthase assembly protein I
MITPEQLRTALGLSEFSARLLLVDVLAVEAASIAKEGEEWSMAAAYGFTPEDLPANLAAQLARAGSAQNFARGKSAVLVGGGLVGASSE